MLKGSIAASDVILFLIGCVFLSVGVATFLIPEIPVHWTGAIVIGVFMMIVPVSNLLRRRSVDTAYVTVYSKIKQVYASIIDGATPTEVADRIFKDTDKIMIGRLAVGDFLSGGQVMSSNFAERLAKGLDAARSATEKLSPAETLNDLSLCRTAYLAEGVRLVNNVNDEYFWVISHDHLIFVDLTKVKENWVDKLAEASVTINAADWANDAKEGIEAVELFADLFDQKIDKDLRELLVKGLSQNLSFVVPIRAVTNIVFRSLFGESGAYYMLLQINYVDRNKTDPNQCVALISPYVAMPTEKGSPSKAVDQSLAWATARLSIVCFACCVVGNLFSKLSLLTESMKYFDELAKSFSVEAPDELGESN